eukprot:7760452-Pyramimonas_sp.AAC.1
MRIPWGVISVAKGTFTFSSVGLLRTSFGCPVSCEVLMAQQTGSTDDPCLDVLTYGQRLIRLSCLDCAAELPSSRVLRMSLKEAVA